MLSVESASCELWRVMLSLLVTVVRIFGFVFFFFKQKTAYEMRISDWSSDVCSSDLHCRYALYVMARRLGKGLARVLVLPGCCSATVIQIGRASCRERVCQYV